MRTFKIIAATAGVVLSLVLHDITAALFAAAFLAEVLGL